MYVRLEDLVSSGADVSELVVFADVVDVEGEHVELPGCVKVFIMCRLLRIKNSNGKLCTITFPYAHRPVIDADIEYDDNDDSDDDSKPGRSGRGHHKKVRIVSVTYTLSDYCDEFELFIFAQSVVMGSMAVTVPFKLNSDMKSKVPEVNVEWRVTPDSSSLPVVRADPAYLPDGSLDDFSKAQSYFYVTSPESPSPSLLVEKHVLACIKGRLAVLEMISHFFDRFPDLETPAREHLEWLFIHLSNAASSSGSNSSLQDVLSHAIDLKIALATSIAISDMVHYREVYENVEQATKAVATSECSEVMTVQRMYFLLDDLDITSLKESTRVEKLMIYADVVEVGKESLKLPGSITVIIMCRVFLLKELPSCTLNFPYLGLGSTVTITPLRIYGLGAGTTSPSIYAKQLIVPHPRRSSYLLCLELMCHIPDSLCVTHPDLLACIEGVVLTMELIICYQSDAATAQTLSCLHLQWLKSHLIQVARSSTSMDAEISKDLGALLFRQRHTTPSTSKWTFSSSKMRFLGAILSEENKALAEKEKDMEELHNSLLKRKKDELDATTQKVFQLQLQMAEQKAAMDKAKEDMDKALLEEEAKQIAMAFVSVLSAIGACVLAFATGGATAGGAAQGVEGAAEAVEKAEKAVSTLKKLVESFKKLMEILKKVQKVIEVVMAIKDLIEKIVDITQMVDAPAMPDLPTNADWDIFVNEVENVADQLPAEVSEGGTWKCKCKNLAAVCREIATTVVYLEQLEYDLVVESLQADVAAKHAKRLQEIKPADVRNYLEMASQMNMRTTRILLNLLKVFKLQRGALLYHYLMPSKPFTARVSIDTVRNALMQNAADAISGMQLLGPSNNFEREYCVCDIPVNLLMQGQDWTFTIPIYGDGNNVPSPSMIMQGDVTIPRADDHGNNNFPSAWYRVRVQDVEIRFSAGHHQPHTDLGEVYLLLQSSSKFQDRGHLGEVLNYEAGAPLYYQYAYNLKSGKTTLRNKPTRDDEGLYMRLTPFTEWRLRLSASAYENKGLCFPTANYPNDPFEKTQIAIVFHLTAIRAVSF
ncbi:hypothetical protein GOP47_0025736 [Adiantum capillus-veneris]|uniref:Uncharacterized protein n=1 Tax=Adiantum capillus-veneris TaxID=13818 RepID=A0A9D4U167_ADICA|nr:hypothetical protein GOP47_0025736 [Adiantum capillus-veneris]